MFKADESQASSIDVERKQIIQKIIKEIKNYVGQSASKNLKLKRFRCQKNDVLNKNVKFCLCANVTERVFHENGYIYNLIT